MRRGYINAAIYRSSATAFLADGGEIVKTGTDEEIEKLLGRDEECVDLHGAFVVPGFIDSHMHLAEYGNYLSNVQLLDCRSLEEVLKRAKQYRDAHADHPWIIGRGYNEEQFPDRRRPERAMLDEISRDRPISLTRSCGHIMVVNTRALELAGIDANTEVAGGRIDYEHGILEETAIELVHAVWPSETVETMKQYILRGAQEAARYGVTAIGSDDLISVTHDWRMVLDAFLQLSYQDKLRLRVSEQCEFDTPQELAAFLDEGYTTGVGDDTFQIGPLKMILDGSLGGRTAAMRADYQDAPGSKGYLHYDREELDTYVKLANSYNMPTIAHAIGDRALDEALHVYERYVLPGNPLGYGIVHCQIMHGEQAEQVCRMKLSCFFQSLFVDDDAPILEQRVGRKLADSSYPYRTLLEGTLAANGSDAPVETPNPLQGIQLAVTRTSLDHSASMNPVECLTAEQALDSYTVNGARILGMESLIGSIETGKKADFAVLEKDPRAVKPEEIAAIRVLMTVQNGETVFER